MRRNIRRKVIAIWMFILFILMVSLPVIPLDTATDLYHFIISHFISDTGSQNAVTGIYLNYRVFDTLFETLLLLVSVIGIIHFSRHEGDY